jgi:hypothetical protein
MKFSSSGFLLGGSVQISRCFSCRLGPFRTSLRSGSGAEVHAEDLLFRKVGVTVKMNGTMTSLNVLPFSAAPKCLVPTVKRAKGSGAGEWHRLL